MNLLVYNSFHMQYFLLQSSYLVSYYLHNIPILEKTNLPMGMLNMLDLHYLHILYVLQLYNQTHSFLYIVYLLVVL